MLRFYTRNKEIMRNLEDSPENRLREARYNYATAFLSYYTAEYDYYASAVLSYNSAIRLLDHALKLAPDFSEASNLREEIWHCSLKLSKNTPHQGDHYDAYRRSDAWESKRQRVLERDGQRCVRCNAQATQVHHKTYDNIGKEPLSDLASVCGNCHNSFHNGSVHLVPQPRYQSITDNEGETTIDDNLFAQMQQRESQNKPANPYTKDPPFRD